MTTDLNVNSDPRCALVVVPGASYAHEAYEEPAIVRGLERLATELQWSHHERGPFGNLIGAGSRVLIKPNFVLHYNQGSGGMEPMVTHSAVIKAVVKAALQANPAEVLVGDAPIQSCHFSKLLEASGVDVWAAELMRTDPRFKGFKDFRRTTCEYVNGVRIAEEDILPQEAFELFDLGTESLLEPITDVNDAFRVTCYDPRVMAKTHAPGTHRYLVAKDVMEADVVINLPKLKTHKKAGITCALKNLIGINGNKEYLPHHRLGGSDLGGDCYPGHNKVKRVLEFVTDQQNLTTSQVAGRVWGGVATQLGRVLHVMGDGLGIEGSWSGNDTIWRTGLDLNRIILYGRAGGMMAKSPQRTVIHLVDAIIAGQGDGPLAPDPLELDVLFAGGNAAAVDLLGALILGYDPQRISIVRGAFEQFQWPITSFEPHDVLLSGDWGAGRVNDVLAGKEFDVVHPLGWRDAARNNEKPHCLTG